MSVFRGERICISAVEVVTVCSNNMGYEPELASVLPRGEAVDSLVCGSHCADVRPDALHSNHCSVCDYYVVDLDRNGCCCHVAKRDSSVLLGFGCRLVVVGCFECCCDFLVVVRVCDCSVEIHFLVRDECFFEKKNRC